MQTYLEQPLSSAEVKARAKEGRLTVVIAVTLTNLTNCNGIDGLNEMADESILGFGRPASLQDLSFKVKGAIPDRDLVLIEVDADASDYLNEMEECDE
jgi:hypothetical protein